MLVSKASAVNNFVIDPHKFYVEMGQEIYRIENDKKELCHVHFDKDGQLIYRNDDPNMGMPINPLDCRKYLEPLAQEAQSFRELFNEIRELNRLESHLNDDILKEFPAQPIIIGGCGRSGTTLLLSILGAHPNIHAIDEELYCFYPNPFRLHRLYKSLPKNNKTTRWCEKTPKNVQAFDDIHEFFNGEVKLIHIIRDCRDVITSVHPNHPEQYWVDIDRWLLDVNAGITCNAPVLNLKYEDLIKNPKEILVDLCKFIGEEFHENMLAHESSSTVMKNVAWNARAMAIYTTQMRKWERTEHSGVLDAFYQNHAALTLMEQLGYM